MCCDRYRIAEPMALAKVSKSEKSACALAMTPRLTIARNTPNSQSKTVGVFRFLFVNVRRNKV